MAVYTRTSEVVYYTYTVCKGETLWDIAAVKLGSGKRYPKIALLNNLDNDVLSIGQVLKIPKK